MISKPLLEWYTINARQLPWRDHPDPYAIWISEIMLQQTRVETVLDYFNHWMQVFPDVESLANACEQDVLIQWEGLGYYSRARNIHKAAKILKSDFDGKLPSDPVELQKLPGIGRYTAAAISSMAFGLDQAALDGNIRRILSAYLISPYQSEPQPPRNFFGDWLKQIFHPVKQVITIRHLWI
jgi:A/G-specific adenine glycosylase